MNLIQYQPNYDLPEELENFINGFFGRQMSYLASDLLDEGLSPGDVVDAVRRAMVACRTAGEDARKHFQPVYTQIEGTLVRDCKLTALGYGLVLMNAKVSSPAAALWQMKLLKKFLQR